MQEKKAACRTAFGASIGRDKFNEGKRISKNVPPPSSPHYDIGILIIKKPLKPGGGGGGYPLYLPIREGSTWKGYLFQASSIWNLDLANLQWSPRNERLIFLAPLIVFKINYMEENLNIHETSLWQTYYISHLALHYIKDPLWRVGISLVEVYEREGKSVILVCKKAQKQERSIHLHTKVCAYSWNQEKVFFQFPESICIIYNLIRMTDKVLLQFFTYTSTRMWQNLPI